MTVFAPDPGNTRPFREALGRFATGVCVLTTAGPDGPVGFTANSFAALSLDPPLVLWSPAKSSTRHALFASAQRYAVHILGAGQDDLMHRFVRGGAGFEGLAPEFAEGGLPVIPGTLARFDCLHHAAHDGGDHTILVGLVTQVTVADGEPLIFSKGRYGGFSHA